jgi:hypothetical protein
MFVCERCRRDVRITTMSLFNEQMICLACVAVEQAHPRYIEALAAEEEAVRQGNLNFPGIGLPLDLQTPQEEKSRQDRKSST